MKKRLDVILVDKGIVESREKAQALILSANVLVNEKPITKCGQQVDENVDIRIKEKIPYVSRGGLKLEKALEVFKVNPQGLVCIDVGSSTGGFTDVLLKRGAVKVFAVDVGTNQLAYTLRKDPRVISMEKVNARALKKEMFEAEIDLAVIDVSFISLTLILESVKSVLRNKQMVALVKPQFEVGESIDGFKGVVKEKEDMFNAIEKCIVFAETIGLYCKSACVSPIKGPKGNTEFFIYLTEEKNNFDFRKLI